MERSQTWCEAGIIFEDQSKLLASPKHAVHHLQMGQVTANLPAAPDSIMSSL